jgi:outer membrane lipoprotein-sorting protein
MAQNNRDAERRVKEAIAELKHSTYEGRFTLLVYNAENEVTDKQTGNITIKGEKFRMTLAGNEVKYDGKTQWVYVSEYNEVSLTEPTAEELREVNPLAMIEHYVATDRISSNEDGTINFYPTQPKESEYFRVELRLNKTNLPTRLTVYQTNGNRVTIYLEEFKKISVDNSSFVFDITKYPNVEVNDLR